MDSPVQDDPYEALGVNKLSSAADIKTAYRKLALKCHPDKVADPQLKAQKADEFHKIQQAYEILQDDEKRSRYDARVRLAELKAEMMKREIGGRPTKDSMYESRPTRPSYPSFSRTSSAQFEVRTPRFTEDYFEDTKSTSSRKHHEPKGGYVRRSSPQTVTPEKDRRAEKEDKSRSERRRAREADVRDSRDRKYYSSTEDVNERTRYEEERKRRDDVVKQKEDEARRYKEYVAKVEEAKRANEEARRAALKNVYEAPSAPRRTSYDSKYSGMADDALRYQATAEQSYSSSRPQMARTSSSQAYGEPRRSRAKGSESRRRSPDIVEERVPPGVSRSATAPEKLRDMAGDRSMPPRSLSHEVPESNYAVPPPPMRRTESMPTQAADSTPQMPSSSRREKESSKSSKLRHTETALQDSGYSSSSPVTPDGSMPYPIPPPATGTPAASIPRTTTYRYPTVTGEALSTSPDKYTASGYKTEVRAPPREREREKDRERRRGYEPSSSRDRDRPPMATVRTVPAPGADHWPRENVRAPSYSHRSPDDERVRDRARERDRESRRSERTREMAYGEVASEYTRKNSLQPKSYKEDQVNVGKKYDYDDIKFAGRSRGHDDSSMRSGRERDRFYDQRERYDRPTMSRSSTFIY